MTAVDVGFAIMLMAGVGIELRGHYRQYGLVHAIMGSVGLVGYVTLAVLIGE